MPAEKAKITVILANLGTPDAPTAPAVRKFLKQFLSDQRVIEIPKPLWQIILRLFSINENTMLKAKPAKKSLLPELKKMRVTLPVNSVIMHILYPSKKSYAQCLISKGICR